MNFFVAFEGNGDIWVTPFKCPTLSHGFAHKYPLTPPFHLRFAVINISCNDFCCVQSYLTTTAPLYIPRNRIEITLRKRNIVSGGSDWNFQIRRIAIHRKSVQVQRYIIKKESLGIESTYLTFGINFRKLPFRRFSRTNYNHVSFPRFQYYFPSIHRLFKSKPRIGCCFDHNFLETCWKSSFDYRFERSSILRFEKSLKTRKRSVGKKDMISV